MNLSYLSYYLEIIVKRINGKELTNPVTNGEYAVLESIIKHHKINFSQKKFFFIDAGANLGNYTIKFSKLCEKYRLNNFSAYLIEPNPKIIETLKLNLKGINCNLIENAIGDKNKKISFFLDSKNKISGSSSSLKHHYLDQEIKLYQITIDSLLKKIK